MAPWSIAVPRGQVVLDLTARSGAARVPARRVALVSAPTETTEQLLDLVGRGDRDAFERLYHRIAGPVLGVVRRVLRDHAQSEEVAQEVLVEVWRTARRFDPSLGGASTWVLTMAHRRAVDRVRSAQASTNRDSKVAQLAEVAPFDEVSETVELNFEREQVRRALGSLTELQRQAVTLAYYG